MSPKSDGFLKYLLKNADTVLFINSMEIFNEHFVSNFN